MQAVLAARIDRLPPEEKRLLQTAAVIGTEVPFALLQAIAELPEEALHRGLAHLQAAEFLYETRLFPEREYTFKHALTHEVAYGSLLQERRRALHARIVEALEALAPDRLAEQVERLAHHALRGEVWDKALAYCRQAGAKAMARSAYREAVASLSRRWWPLRHLPESRDTREQAIDLRLDLRMRSAPLGRTTSASSTTCARPRPSPRPWTIHGGWGRSLPIWPDYFRTMGDHDRAIASGQRALALAAALGDVVLQVMAHYYPGPWSTTPWATIVGRSTASGRPCVPRRRAAPSSASACRPASVLSRAWLGLVPCRAGEFAEGIACGEEGVRMAEAVDHPYSLIVAYIGVGLLYLRKGDLHQAIPVLERALALCQAGISRSCFPRLASALGTAYALSGRVAEALPLLEQAVEQTSRNAQTMDVQSLWVAHAERGTSAGRPHGGGAATRSACARARP